MGYLRIVTPHKLPKEKALEKTKMLFTKVQEMHFGDIICLKERWDKTKGKISFIFKDDKIKLSIDVNSYNIRIYGDIPLNKAIFTGYLRVNIMMEAIKLLS